MKQYKTISYSLMIGDLFHIGHLKMLETAKKNADYHICGVISDQIVSKWIPPLICKFEERKEVIDKVEFVDEAILQDSLDPTDNLKIIHERFPNAKILLVQTHILGSNSILGIEYIEQINGDIIQHKFYSNLSREFIQNTFINEFIQKRDIDKLSVNNLQIGDIDYFQKYFSTKANTIQSLKRILKNAVIENEFVFTVGQWKIERDSIVKSIVDIFKDSKIVVRSSSLNEDSIDFSNAGHYESVLNVNSSLVNEIESAVKTVIKSYIKTGTCIEEDQILVQRQTDDVIISGVIFTRNLLSNTPYYVINYDDNTTYTDTVTSGIANSKIEILRNLELNEIDEKWQSLILSVKEIETFFNSITLDIEFAIKSTGEIVIFQVRPLAANSKFYSLDDEHIKKYINKIKQEYINKYRTYKPLNGIPVNNYILSDMAFWNPAELIGDRPNYLDYSLFNHLLMKTNWNKALIPLGYTYIDEPLMEYIANKPYINVNCAFLSLLPQKLPVPLKTKLLTFYNFKLRNNPELHDKIEFEIVHSCYSFNFDLLAIELRENSFTNDEIILIKKSLIFLTNKVLEAYNSHFDNDTSSIEILNTKYSNLKKKLSTTIDWNEKLEIVYQLIEDCKSLGTTQFSRIARMAFIGKTLLKSIQALSLISTKDLDTFLGSISTVATEFDNDFSQLRSKKIDIKKFVDKYGHLRPGTYDVTILPYSMNTSYFQDDNNSYETLESLPESQQLFVKNVEDKICTIFTKMCAINKINSNGRSIINFIKRSTQLREYFKFIYTKNISLALEIITEVGEECGFTRELISNLDYYSIVNCKNILSKDETINIWNNLINGRIEEKRINSQISLPPIIFSENDFVNVSTHLTKPNFITENTLVGDIIILDNNNENININNKVIVLEKADPGYDWIFTKNIKALITKYGGVASHMAIRCAEFKIPAAIGCGELIFMNVTKASKVFMDCKNKTIRTV